jgi:hypothetical protein
MTAPRMESRAMKAPHHSGIDRRQRRSSEPLTAMQLQLDHVCRQRELDAIILCSERGETAASAGDRILGERLSVQSPWLVDRAEHEVNETLSFLWDTYPDLNTTRVVARTIPVGFLTERLILIGIGRDTSLAESVERVACGVDRIIRQAAA